MKYLCSKCKKEFENDKDSTRIQKNILTGKYICFDCAYDEYYELNFTDLQKQIALEKARKHIDSSVGYLKLYIPRWSEDL